LLIISKKAPVWGLFCFLDAFLATRVTKIKRKRHGKYRMREKALLAKEILAFLAPFAA